MPTDAPTQAPHAPPETHPTEHPLEGLKLIYGEWALAQVLDPASGQPTGEKAFVKNVLPGERLTGTPTPGPKGKTRAFQPVHWEATSPHRITPRCAVIDACGGCHWQHVAPEQQGQWKQTIVAESLIRLGGLTNPPIRPLLSPQDEAHLWHYRSKVQWHVQIKGTAPDIQAHLGYHPPQSHEVVTFETCHIMPESWHAVKNRLEAEMTQVLKAHPRTPHPESVTIKQTHDRQFLLGIALRPAPGEKAPQNDPTPWTPLGQALQTEFPLCRGVLLISGQTEQAIPLWGVNYLTETSFAHPLRVSFASFFQIHHTQAQSIIALLENDLPAEPVSHLVDVYGGVGLFAAALAHRIQQGTVLELAASSVADAQFNFAQEGLSHLQVIGGDVKNTLLSPKLPKSWSITVLDPPRAGCPESVLAQISNKTEKHIYYLSCNPTTLARDLKYLTQQGWHTAWVQPIDMFPQTYHIETLVRLDKHPATPL